MAGEPNHPVWFRGGYKDAQGKARRLVSGATKQAITDYAAKHGKTVEDFTSITRTAKVRSGDVKREKTVVRWYGLMSA